MLVVENLSVNYGGVRALRGVSLKVDQGQICTLIGSNGAGKSTTVRAISGQIKGMGGSIISGCITFEDQAITTIPVHHIARLGVVQVPEGRRVFPNLTVRENLFMGGYNRSRDSGFASDIEHIFSLFPRLKERYNQLGGTLSGGERQMLAIGRAIMAKPKLIMMDEPSLGLAPNVVDEVFDIIQDINSAGTTILLIEQNAMAALSVSDYGYVLETGEIRMEGPGKELLDDERVINAYLG
ncbi:MAG: ABC transporter ATP-binding protein [Desulfobacteraceae bacterium]|uniref:ABC transporter ATP-binding protein n=1 Tax=Candidatus Desulfacyla euxinica TaxID=2841693 RepID=A0A8J6MYZ5_9DELT|nr:ABC transporter ATP-binding protein [Candidatus Desulfacyla euxinica]MBL6977774.1 ABC transporter ATP-binding protein [Desulfobacteraceae bacterium]